MKILFVCRANSGRSQMAMELYNQIYPGEADSAGTQVDQPGQMLRDRPTARSAIAAMHELGIDMSLNRRCQLTPDMLNNYDHVVVLAETKAIPGYLNIWPGAEFWHVEDTKVQGTVRASLIRDKLNLRIKELGRRMHAPATQLVVQ
jgi:protein-tyrosine-phosphatase